MNFPHVKTPAVWKGSCRESTITALGAASPPSPQEKTHLTTFVTKDTVVYSKSLDEALMNPYGTH